MFSADMVAVRPRDGAAVAEAIGFALDSLDGPAAGAPACDPAAMRAAQNRYVAGQKRNRHMRRMLAGCVGEALADAFIDEVPFPEAP